MVPSFAMTHPGGATVCKVSSASPVEKPPRAAKAAKPKADPKPPAKPSRADGFREAVAPACKAHPKPSAAKRVKAK